MFRETLPQEFKVKVMQQNKAGHMSSSSGLCARCAVEAHLKVYWVLMLSVTLEVLLLYVLAITRGCNERISALRTSSSAGLTVEC